MKLNHLLEKYSENIKQYLENNCRAHLQTKFRTLVIKYPAFRTIKNAVTWKLHFRRKLIFLRKFDLSKAIHRQYFKSLSLWP